MVNDLNNVSQKDYSKIENKKNICINVFCYGNDLVYPVRLSDEKFEKCRGLLLIADENKSHYFYIKGFIGFMCNKAKIRIKNTFSDIIFYTTIVKKSCKNIKRFVKNKW